MGAGGGGGGGGPPPPCSGYQDFFLHFFMLALIKLLKKILAFWTFITDIVGINPIQVVVFYLGGNKVAYRI
jgi:hypothetical protein